MSALEMIGTFEKNFSGKRIININTKTERQLRSITEDKGLRGYYKLKKADLVASLLEQSTEEMPTPPPRSSMSGLHDSAKKTLKGDVESEANKANQEEEDIDLTPHEKERAFKGAFKSFMIPGAPKTGIDSYFDQAKPHIKTLIKNQLKEMGSAKIIMTLWVRWKKPLESLIELDPEDLEHAQDTEGNTSDKGRPALSVNPSPQEMDEFEKQEMKKGRSVVKNKLKKRYDWYVDYVPKPIKTAASKAFLRAKNSILGLYDGVKKTLKGQAEDNTDLTAHKNERIPNHNYIRFERPFNRLMTEFFEGSDINDLIQRMLAYIETQVENPRKPGSGFTLDKIMHLFINFHRRVLTRGGSYIELPKWIKSKKAVINPQKKYEEYFKWAVIAALHHEEIKKDHQRMSRLRPYEKQYNWKGLEFPVSVKKIDKFEKNNPGIAVYVLFSNNKNQNIYTARRSECNVKCKNQVNLLMLVDGEKRHYTTIKSISRLLSKLNGKTRRAYHFCMNCLNGFRKASVLQ